MNSEARDTLAAHRKFVILQYASEFGNVKKVCSEFEVARASFYRWKKAYNTEGKAGLLSSVTSKPATSGRFKTDHIEGYFFCLARAPLGAQALSFSR